MPRPRPYMFCRYSFLVDEDLLNGKAQITALQELQGQFFANGRSAERAGKYDTVIMRPRSFDIGGELVLVWSVGQKVDVRIGVRYDDMTDQIELVAINDDTVRYNDFVAVPRLGVLAVDDRSGERHLGAKSAIARLRSSFQNVDGGAVNVEMTTTSADVDFALNQWELREVTFKVRPYNPHPIDELSKQLSEAMKREGIHTLRASAKPKPGETMRPNEGPIDQARSLAGDGYGQVGVRGVMKDGHVAYIPRPQFEDERARNQKIQAKPREMRVYIETDGDEDDESFQNAAKALVNFYDREPREA